MNFKNQSLKQAYTESQNIIASRISQLDDISEDINTLESVLKQAGISFTYRYLFHETSQSASLWRSQADPYEPDGYRHDGLTKTAHYIVWDREKKRILYEVENTNCEYLGKNNTRCTPYQTEVSISIPLHDAKVHVRLKTLNELHIFYSKIIDQIKRVDLQDLVIEKSPSLNPYLNPSFDDEVPF